MWKTCTISPLLLILILPPCGHALLNFKIYTGSNMMTWKEAQAFCRKHHTDLVTIRNEAENQHYRSVYGWIGLYKDAPEGPWKWSPGDEKANFTLWDKGEPYTDNYCGFIYPPETWRTDHCNSKHSFACYDELQVLVKENKTWEEALDHCRSLGRVDTNNPASANWNHSYDLLTLTSLADHAYAWRNAQQATTDEVWTGLRFLAGEWLWVSGAMVQYNISRCEADRSCGVLEKNSASPFGIRSCNEKRNFICYKKP